MSRWNAGGPISFAALWFTVLALAASLAFVVIDIYSLDRPESLEETMLRKSEVEVLRLRVEQLETNGGKS